MEFRAGMPSVRRPWGALAHMMICGSLKRESRARQAKAVRCRSRRERGTPFEVGASARDTLADALVWQYQRAVDAQLGADVHVFSEHADAFDARPPAHRGAPAEDRVEHDRVRAHARALEQDAAREAHAVLDDATGPYDDVGPDLAARAHARGLVLHHVTAA